MLKLAVIGKDVSKSLSPKMHKFILGKLGYDCVYDNISIPENEFEEKIGGILSAYDGINVTIPYKLSIIPHLNKTEGDAVTFGAVNTVKTDGLTGYNTDGEGFMMMIDNAGVDTKNKSVLVLGAGGVGRTVIKKLVSRGANVYAYEMFRDRLDALHDEFPYFTPIYSVEDKPYDVIINCTGVGMHKSEGISPVEESLLKLCGAAVDLIYVPAQSEFLRLAAKNGKKTVNGESMLFYQAYYGDCIYLSLAPDGAEAEKLYKEYKLL